MSFWQTVAQIVAGKPKPQKVWLSPQGTDHFNYWFLLTKIAQLTEKWTRYVKYSTECNSSMSSKEFQKVVQQRCQWSYVELFPGAS